MKSTSSSIKLLLAVVVLTLSPSSSQRITLTAGGDEQQQCPMLGCCDFDCCGPGTSWDTTGEVCILDFSSEGFNGSFPSYYKKGCIERVCCEDDCCDIDTFYDVDLQCCVEAEIPSSSPLMSPTAPALAPTPTPPTATGAVKGTVFEDTNNNGKQDPGEQGILNVDVVITDKNGDTQTVTTNSNGEYSATVPADVVITDKDGDTQTATTNSNGEYSATVPAGSSQDPGDSPTAAPTPTPTGTVGGTIFDNANNNGKQDPGEQGILNADIVITDKNGSTQTVTTSSNGEYSATVPAGSTKIDIVESTLPAGGVQTVGTDPTTVSVPAGGVATDLDGFYFPTDAPTKSPTKAPTPAPTLRPTKQPTKPPTVLPTTSPTVAPTARPTLRPTNRPTVAPTAAPIATGPPAGPGGCELVTVGFDKDPNGNDIVKGTYVENEWISLGLNLYAEGGVGSRPRIFDTADPGGEKPSDCGDSDLGAPNRYCPGGGPGKGVDGEPGKPGENCEPLGNVLIVQEPGEDCPDDNGEGGLITFDFPFGTGQYVKELGLLDVDYDTIVVVVTQTPNGFSEREIVVPLLGDNSYQVLEIDEENVKWIKVMFKRSGAVTSITFCPK